MESNKEEKITSVSEENIYKLNGRVPLRKAIPFGLQHVLAMFVSNLAPVLIVCSAAVLRSNGAHLSSAEITQLLQCINIRAAQSSFPPADRLIRYIYLSC